MSQPLGTWSWLTRCSRPRASGEVVESAGVGHLGAAPHLSVCVAASYVLSWRGMCARMC